MGLGEFSGLVESLQAPNSNTVMTRVENISVDRIIKMELLSDPVNGHIHSMAYNVAREKRTCERTNLLLLEIS